ncbi:alpha/beta fold hydrolase [Actinophytocola algeriensis]|uniref:3-oxoadipate enol-lactonase n=1 Tax=Actinophytocola algeriensis TaxID=1768010 RepID=A0A7W7VGM2_9PSEU|nr:alpha/beta fold hydrolase [Actinophytocola algeriensis]MBB4909511.1 3-oxoadipate enol-lactonase [Actinophytocola algeriensis]MBE1475501.1 3-oxoadipate enol-lactonase [Actinophytocola algeriensis]
MKALLLHSLAMSGGLWQPLQERLAVPSVAMDARGHGESTWDGSPFTIEDLAADAAALVEARADGPVAVAGMSMGGCVAIALAGTRPELVDRLVLADTTADYGPGKVTAWADRADNAIHKPRDRQLAFQVDRWFSPAFAKEDPAEVKRVSELFIATDSRAHAQACLALGAFDGTALLPGITARTLVVVGEHDYATPPAMAGTLAEGIPGARLHIFEKARHFSVFEASGGLDLVAAHLEGRS